MKVGDRVGLSERSKAFLIENPTYSRFKYFKIYNSGIITKLDNVLCHVEFDKRNHTWFYRYELELFSDNHIGKPFKTLPKI